VSKLSPVSSSTISVVDDDSEVRGSIASFLRSAELQVSSYESAESFLAEADRTRTGCLITDLHMPGMDGLALQRELVRAEWRVPIIIMTAFPTSEARERALADGAIAFLDKPVDPELLLAEVERALKLGNAIPGPANDAS